MGKTTVPFDEGAYHAGRQEEPVPPSSKTNTTAGTGNAITEQVNANIPFGDGVVDSQSLNGNSELLKRTSADPVTPQHNGSASKETDPGNSVSKEPGSTSPNYDDGIEPGYIGKTGRGSGPMIPVRGTGFEPKK